MRSFHIHAINGLSSFRFEIYAPASGYIWGAIIFSAQALNEALPHERSYAHLIPHDSNLEHYLNARSTGAWRRRLRRMIVHKLSVAETNLRTTDDIGVFPRRVTVGGCRPVE